MKPFLIWVGGKTRSMKHILKNLPKEYNKYYEPFIGGGSVFMRLNNKKAYLSDKNKQLINTYKQIKKNGKKVTNSVNKLIIQYNNSKNKRSYYEKIRKLYNQEIMKNGTFYSSILFIFLGRASFNGLYRLNKKGLYNSPWGRHDKLKMFCYKKEDMGRSCINLFEISDYLNNSTVRLEYKDYTHILKYVKKNDFVYLDPPYYPLTTNKTNFTSYQTNAWTLEDHEKFIQFVHKLDKKKCYILMSNNNSKELLKSFKNFTIVKIKTLRSIGAKSNVKKNVSEVLIKNY